MTIVATPAAGVDRVPAPHCEPAALVVSQSRSLATELLLQHSILFDEKLDGLGLLPVHPADERREE